MCSVRCFLESLLLRCLIYWVFPEFVFSNLFLHCLTYFVTFIFWIDWPILHCQSLLCLAYCCVIWHLNNQQAKTCLRWQLSSQQSGIMCLYITSWTTITIGGALRKSWFYSKIMRSLCLLLWSNNNRRALEKDVANFWLMFILALSNLFYIVWVCLSNLFLHCLTYSVFFLSFFI